MADEGLVVRNAEHSCSGLGFGPVGDPSWSGTHDSHWLEGSRPAPPREAGPRLIGGLPSGVKDTCHPPVASVHIFSTTLGFASLMRNDSII